MPWFGYRQKRKSRFMSRVVERVPAQRVLEQGVRCVEMGRGSRGMFQG